MLRSRVLTSIDPARLANAVSRPGIDPRIWVSYAVLLADPKVVTEANYEDIVADIMLLPSGTVETARVGAVYAGNGFGLYAPLYKDDEVVVIAPSGDPDEGLVITHRMWSPADKPPAEITEETQNDLWLVVQPNQSLRVSAKGSGNVYLTVDTGKVYLGAADGTEAAAKGESLKDYLVSLVSALRNHTHPLPIGATSPAGPVFPSPSNAILSTTTQVK